MSKVFGYMRVSQSTQTVENQKQELLASKLSITEWYADEAVSGTTKQMERKGFSSMVAAAEAGDLIVMAKLDRLGRNALDVQTTLKELKNKGLKVIVLQFGGMDINSPAGKLMMVMLSAVAEMEMDLLKERIHAGLTRAKTEGVVMGAPTKIKPEVMKEICKLKSEGVTLDVISQRHGVDRATAGRNIKRWKNDLEGYTREFESRSVHIQMKRLKVKAAV